MAPVRIFPWFDFLSNACCLTTFSIFTDFCHHIKSFHHYFNESLPSLKRQLAPCRSSFPLLRNAPQPLLKSPSWTGATVQVGGRLDGSTLLCSERRVSQDRLSSVSMTASMSIHAIPALRDAAIASTYVALIKKKWDFLMFMGCEEERM